MRPSGETPARRPRRQAPRHGVWRRRRASAARRPRRACRRQIVGEHAGLLVEVRQVALDPVEVDALLHQLEVVRDLGLASARGRAGPRAHRPPSASRARPRDTRRPPWARHLRCSGRCSARSGAASRSRRRRARRGPGASRRRDRRRAPRRARRTSRAPRGLDALVAHAREASGRLLQIDGPAGCEREWLEHVRALRRQRAQQSPGRRHDDRRAAARRVRAAPVHGRRRPRGLVLGRPGGIRALGEVQHAPGGRYAAACRT
jgi:hypothetical protein